ncbi:NPCBM/NEW2 domain-containing protein [Amycolatopsis acidiphila]|uniref:Alpha-galactosidase n=1 Tax=Amycolatopsis acidiphila TaxID=715473 RepID=A0A558A4M0_9PSEU|nr:NPCBM/NEW2 domain-containing protein [Amycolatopsis acidiphila]TVT19203.1 alpha-galactosidase [Amycolatopsis acidiphila]UIJ62023.1 NPCBM/NEW2 domain-containing protein [Amycolatopsis acidiphila]GHG56596.1 alpha-galactosidase [Amycolatopsis acidiphila]
MVVRFARWGGIVLSTLVLVLGFAPVASAVPVAGSSSGSRLTAPPMGWNDWNKFGCGVTEAVIRETADALVRTGLRDAGYRYVNVDDCWEAGSRDTAGHLQADPMTFPGGMAALAEYVHARGLRFGIYTAAGDKTCQGRPASGGHYQQDARDFAAWGVDYVKFDWCGAQGDPYQLATQFRAALDATGRTMVLGVSRHGNPWTWPTHPADLWRTSADIDDQWSSLLRNTEEEAGLATKAGRGVGWNDPDMLQVGNGGMNTEEYRAHLSLWSVLAAPLLMGNDVRTADQATVDLLGNREVVAVDQDPLGVPGDRVRSDGDREVWSRPLAGGDVAVALFNRGATSAEIRTDAREVGLRPAAGYDLRDLWEHRDTQSAGGISALVPPHGVVLFRVSADQARSAPQVTVSTDTGFVEGGRPTPVTVSVRNEGFVPVRVDRVGLDAPAGWQVTRLRQDVPVTVAGHPVTARFEVTAPPGASDAAFGLTAEGGGVTYRSQAQVVVPPAPPDGNVALSGQPRLQTDNGWYLPMKVDHSFGPDDFCGDCQGGPLTLDGEQYTTGLGTYASAQVGYYLGGRCRTFETTAGIDDEVLGMTWPGPQNVKGTARFLVYGDGRLLFDSGLLRAGDHPAQARLDVRGVRELKLVNHSGGDGNFADHADWAGMRASC